jgi:ABC-type multidrug transport system fused ATPase/permease subunit
MSHKCSYRGGCYEEFGEIQGELKDMIIAIYVDAVIYMVLAIYLYQIVPQSYGVPKHPCFCCKKLKRKALRRKSSAHAMADHIPLTKEEAALEDDDVREARKQVMAIKEADYEQYPLIVKEIRKVYPAYGNRPPNTANKNISFFVNKGEMFGLLGPNGAGKTTLIT